MSVDTVSELRRAGNRPPQFEKTRQHPRARLRRSGAEGRKSVRQVPGSFHLTTIFAHVREFAKRWIIETFFAMKSPWEQFCERIKQHAGTFTPSDKQIADYLLRSYPKCLLDNASDIANELRLTVSTVTRFFPKVGYKSIRNVRAKFRQHLDFIVNSPLDRYRQRHTAVRPSDSLPHKALQADLSNIQGTFSILCTDDVLSLAKLLTDQSTSVYVMGARKSFALAFYFYIQLSVLRGGVFLMRTEHSLMVDSLTEVRPGDKLVLFDFRRYPHILAQTAQAFAQQGGEVILFTDSPLTHTSKLAKLAFLIKTAGASPLDSYTAGFTLINAIMAEFIGISGDPVRVRYERLEQLYTYFDFWSWQRGSAGDSSVRAHRSSFRDGKKRLTSKERPRR